MSKENQEENKEVKKQRPWDKYKESNPLNFVKAVAKNQFVPTDVKDSRMKTCMNCEHFQKTTRTCSICHCFLPAKTSVPREFCPIHKWEVWNESADVS